MNPIRNPYSPGAGTPPPALSGRDEMLEQVRVAIERIRLGRSSKSVLMIGLRGVGKTVLLDQMRLDAENSGIHTIRIEAPEERSLPGILAPQLRQALLKLSRIKKAKNLAQRALRALAGFAKLKVKYDDLEVSLDIDPEPGLADNGDLESDLQDLLMAVGEAAKAADSAFVMFIDELQYVPEKQLGSLIAALHRAAQMQMPVTLVGAGLPQLTGQMGKAKSYAERLFDFPFIGALEPDEARLALSLPAEEENVEFSPPALEYLVQQTQGYPYFLQEWGKHAWDVADESPITLSDCQQATITAIAALDASFFRVRFDRLTPSEKRYLRAMAELGAGPHRSGDIADMLERKSSSLAPTRAKLIHKGMIWSPSHGDTAFTVPLFDQYMKRIMPEG
ncbi:MAG: AAA family ATPase [Akkermansiaceae bacterium]